MSYRIGETAILARIREMPAYNADNSSQGDWRIIFSGKAASYVVLRPGPWNNAQETLTVNTRAWTTVIEVLRRYGDIDAPLNLQDDVEAIVAYLEKWPRLGGTTGVQRAFVTGGNDMHEREFKNDSLWVVWEINCVWTEAKNVVRLE